MIMEELLNLFRKKQEEKVDAVIVRSGKEYQGLEYLTPQDNPKEGEVQLSQAQSLEPSISKRV